MAQYKVTVLGVQGINNKIYGPNEIVTDKHFPEGNAEKLAKEGKLVRFDEPKDDKPKGKFGKHKVDETEKIEE
jgi:hypothetical protein